MTVLWGSLLCAGILVVAAAVAFAVHFAVHTYQLQHKRSGAWYGDFSMISPDSPSETPAADYGKRAVVACSGQKGDNGKLFEYRGYNDCKSLSMMYNGDNVCQWSCLGKGDCRTVCPAAAITVSGGVAVIGKTCIGCGACVPVCPRHIISLVPESADCAVFCSSGAGADTAVLCSAGCTACGTCANVAGYAGFHMDYDRNHAYVDYRSSGSRDIGIQKCASGCIKELPQTEKNDIKKYRIWIAINSIQTVFAKYFGINKLG